MAVLSKKADAKAGFSKQVLIRPDIHRAVAVAAAKQGCSIQQVLDSVLREHFGDVLESLALETMQRD